MQTALPAELLATDRGARADAILRSCVHCGFCLATCPTYQVLGSELDSPRGRIYLIKEMLEEKAVSAITRRHLDRCLTCRSCETTCPSGVDYHSLLDIGRYEIEQRAPRSLPVRSFRFLLRNILSRRRVFGPLLRLGQLFRPLLPGALKEHVTRRAVPLPEVSSRHQRSMILVQGCVQPGLSPDTNRAAALLLDRLGISVVSVAAETCCGALGHHLNAQEQALEQARRNIDAWWPLLREGAEAIVMTASGCSVFVRDYPALLAADEVYGQRAREVVEKLRDISEVLLNEDLDALALTAAPGLSWHCPCSAQHGQDLDKPVRKVLQRLGFELPPIRDAQLCCGSAGTYSLFEPGTATQLRQRKLSALEASGPDYIVTANIGCQTHLSAGAQVPVLHWVELLARHLDDAPSPPD